MDDFLLRFAQCSDPTDVSTCSFSIVREGLIVALLSIGTLIGALLGASCRFETISAIPLSLNLQTSTIYCSYLITNKT